MAKVATAMAQLTLDAEVAKLVTRVGALPQPLNHIREYKISRSSGDATWVTVMFIADDEFCKPTEVTGHQEIPIGEGE